MFDFQKCTYVCACLLRSRKHMQQHINYSRDSVYHIIHTINPFKKCTIRNEQYKYIVWVFIVFHNQPSSFVMSLLINIYLSLSIFFSIYIWGDGMTTWKWRNDDDDWCWGRDDVLHLRIEMSPKYLRQTCSPNVDQTSTYMLTCMIHHLLYCPPTFHLTRDHLTS